MASVQSTRAHLSVAPACGGALSAPDRPWLCRVRRLIVLGLRTPKVNSTHAEKGVSLTASSIAGGGYPATNAPLLQRRQFELAAGRPSSVSPITFASGTRCPKSIDATRPPSIAVPPSVPRSSWSLTSRCTGGLATWGFTDPAHRRATSAPWRPR